MKNEMYAFYDKEKGVVSMCFNPDEKVVLLDLLYKSINFYRDDGRFTMDDEDEYILHIEEYVLNEVNIQLNKSDINLFLTVLENGVQLFYMPECMALAELIRHLEGVAGLMDGTGWTAKMMPEALKATLGEMKYRVRLAGDLRKYLKDALDCFSEPEEQSVKEPPVMEPDEMPF